MRTRDETPPADDGSAVSKTRRKKAMHDLQSLGEALVDLDRKRLAELDLPERLVDAVAAARGITKHEARRRQLQYIGKLMRDVDPAPIADALERMAEGPRAEKAHFAELERWRDRLLADDAALDDFVARHPGADRARLATLVRDARAERAGGATPKQFRELFRVLKTLVAPG
jgi:ribosome-associated protein